MGTGSAQAFDQAHTDWQAITAKHVKEGLVNYRAVSRDPAFKRYVTELGTVSAVELNRWSREQRLAYWINAYNAFTIQAILDHYPLKRRGLKGRLYPSNSIRQIPGVWKKLTFQAGGRKITLHDIEHEVLRKQFVEPRIHFAIVCASIGCPLLADHAFTADKLEAQLSAAESGFVSDPEKVKVDGPGKTLYLSKIFDWFSDDFPPTAETKKYGDQAGAVAACLRHLPTHQANALRGSTYSIKWLDYDWSLNEQ